MMYGIYKNGSTEPANIYTDICEAVQAVNAANVAAGCDMNELYRVYTIGVVFYH